MENVIIQTAFLGDLVLSIPLIRQTSRMFPDRRVTVVCRAGLGDLLRTLKVADRVIEVNKREPGQWRQQQREILALEVDNVICPHRSPRTATLVWRMRARGAKVGFHQWWNAPVFNHRVREPMHLPDALRQLSLLTALSPSFAEEFSQACAQEEIFNSQETERAVDFRQVFIPPWASLSDKGLEVTNVKEREPILYLAPGSVWATKRWRVSGFVDVAKAALGRGWRVVLVGAPDERALCAEVEKAAKGCENRAGEWRLTDTVENFSRGRALVANDSGAIHLAALAGLPTVAVFGPTTLALGFRPWQRQAIVVQKNGLTCRPCGKHGHHRCPIRTHDCMEKLESQSVIAALARVTGERFEAPEAANATVVTG